MNDKTRAAMQQALEALDVLLTEPMAKIAADKAEALLLRAAPALREALSEQDVVLGLEPEVLAKLESDLANQATISSGLCGGCAKKAADGWALYCVECWEKAEQEPVAKPMDKAERENWYKEVIATTEDVIAEKERIAEHRALITRNNAIIAASQQPVKELELTDDEISRLWYDSSYGDSGIDFARAVIAAYREKNK